jgi:hypothetical protein
LPIPIERCFCYVYRRLNNVTVVLNKFTMIVVNSHKASRKLKT